MRLHLGPTAFVRYPRTPLALLFCAKEVLARLTNNPRLPYAYPALASFAGAVSALDDAQARDRTPAGTAARDANGVRVYQHLGRVVQFVQEAADAQPTEADAVALIVSTGLSVKKPRTYRKPALAAKHTGVPGEVLLVALVVAGAGAYYWEYSDDMTTWVAVPETRRARVTLTGLTPVRRYHFRFRTLTPDGKTGYSPVVSFVVH